MTSATQRMLAAVATAWIVVWNASAQVQGQRQAPGQAPSRWVKLAPIPEPSEEYDGAAASGKLYLFGGNPVGEGGTPGAPQGRVWEYDPATDKWTKKKPMPLPAHHNAVVGYRGKIYVFGGGIQREHGGPNQIPANNAWEYDPATDSWKALAPMPTKRLQAIAVEASGKIYVMGGVGNYPGREDASLDAARPHRVMDANEAYDPATNRWETRNTMPTPRNHLFAGAVGGKIYLIGGRLASAFVTSGSSTDIVEEYDPATDQWGAVKARMPTPRNGGASATYGGRIYAAGGQTINSIHLSVSRALEAYDPATNQWTTLPVMPTARHGVMGAVIGNRLHLVSGHITAAFGGGEALNIGDHDGFEFTEK